MAITKEILISIQPQWVAKILNREKTIEIRKTKPKCKMPVKVYIYVTKNKSWGDKLIYVTDPLNVTDPFYELGYKFNSIPKVNGKVVAEFILNKCDGFTVGSFGNDDLEKPACMEYKDFIKYFYKPEELDGNTIKIGYAWHIEDLVIYDEPKGLSAFYSIKECEPATNIYGEPQTWEQRHKKCIASGHGIPIECHKCKSLIAGEDYISEESGVMLFDYSCKTNHHAPLTKAPQSWQYVNHVEKEN